MKPAVFKSTSRGMTNTEEGTSGAVDIRALFGLQIRCFKLQSRIWLHTTGSLRHAYRVDVYIIFVV